MTSIANLIPTIGLGTYGRTGDAGMASILGDEPEKLDCNLNIPSDFANLGVTSRHFDWLVGQALADCSNPTALVLPALATVEMSSASPYGSAAVDLVVLSTTHGAFYASRPSRFTTHDV
jgi:hypothetical protein